MKKCLGFTFLFLATSPLINAALVNLGGTNLSATLQLNGGSYSAGPFTISENDGVIFEFMAAGNTPAISLIFEDDGSPYLFSDRQGVLSIATFGSPAIIQAGFTLTVTGLFAASGSAEEISGFDFVDGYEEGLLIDTLITEYDAQTGTLIIRSEQDISILEMSNLTAQGRFLTAIPEPSSAAVCGAFFSVILLTARRRHCGRSQ